MQPAIAAQATRRVTSRGDNQTRPREHQPSGKPGTGQFCRHDESVGRTHDRLSRSSTPGRILERDTRHPRQGQALRRPAEAVGDAAGVDMGSVQRRVRGTVRSTGALHCSGGALASAAETHRGRCAARPMGGRPAHQLPEGNSRPRPRQTPACPGVRRTACLAAAFVELNFAAQQVADRVIRRRALPADRRASRLLWLQALADGFDLLGGTAP